MHTPTQARIQWGHGRNSGMARHGACGLLWWQAGNETSHCPKCHRTFSSLAGFDRHQRIEDDGSITCMDPNVYTDADERLVFELTPVTHYGETVEGIWRIVPRSQRRVLG